VEQNPEERRGKWEKDGARGKPGRAKKETFSKKRGGIKGASTKSNAGEEGKVKTIQGSLKEAGLV